MGPIRVVIAEDEQLILHNLVKKVQQIDPIFEVCGTAQDGAAALHLLEDSSPDLLITDIQMPVMNGLELLKQTSLLFPHVKKIVLSGYDEFEYARQALRYETADYLLKPVKQTELEQALGRIKMQLDKERNQAKVHKLSIPENRTYSPEQIVDMIQLFIKNNYRQELTLEQISKQFNFNASYLTKLFIKHTGEPPSKYLITLRINEARHLLKNQKELSVKEIGERVGYPNPYYFSRIFKQVAGVTPSEFRLQ